MRSGGVEVADMRRYVRMLDHLIGNVATMGGRRCLGYATSMSYSWSCNNNDFFTSRFPPRRLRVGSFFDGE